jgi:hypothetical protein
MEPDHQKESNQCQMTERAIGGLHGKAPVE